MKTVVVNQPFDGGKFAARYRLGQFDFSMNGNTLSYPDSVTDNPPIFDPPDPPTPQGTLEWEAGPIPNTVRLVAKFNNKKSSVVVAGQETNVYRMYTSPGPLVSGAGLSRKEYHITEKADIPLLQPTPIDGDTLYILGDGEYRYSNAAWRRVLYGPVLDSPADQLNLYVGLDAAMDAAINPSQGPQVDPRIKAVLVELRKLI